MYFITIRKNSAMKHISSRLLTYALCLLAMSLLMACEEDTELPACPPLDESSLSREQQVFLDIVFGNEFGSDVERLRKWRRDISIYVPEPPEPFLQNELESVITEINRLSETVMLQQVSREADANMIVFFGDGATYVSEYEDQAAGLTGSNLGLFSIDWNRQTYEISRATVWVDVVNESDPDCLRHILREELTQALGLTNDTDAYPESIFYSEFTCLPAYTELDEQYIRDFLSADLRVGMCRGEVVVN
jgi:hypothetical protein